MVLMRKKANFAESGAVQICRTGGRIRCALRRYVVLLALCLAIGCACANREALAAGEAFDAPTDTPVPSAAPALAETPAPSDAGSWYAARTAELRKWMSLYGGYSGAALDARVQAMEIDPARPMIALTFDDGPVAGVTDAIVQILAQNDCRATFFICGWRTKKEATARLLETILGEGNEIGNHTWNHEKLSVANGKVMMTTLSRTNKAVFDLTGYEVHSMRPPGGSIGPGVRRYAKTNELAVVLWAQSGNVHEKDPEKIAENVFRQIVNGKELENGDIVLLHDTKPNMVEAVAILVPRLCEAGYQLVTVQELLQFSDRGFVYGEVYHKQNEAAKG